MIKALVINNGIHGLERLYQSGPRLHYAFVNTSADFSPDLKPYDLLIVPNGTDHIAMHKICNKVRAFLNAGKTLFCFCGWFTNWVPGNRWVMDNSKKSIDVRYQKGTDKYGILDGVDMDEFSFYEGISGWWACGFIEAAPGADVLISDTWGRALMVIDEATTAGKIVLSASAPLADFDFSDEPDAQYSALLTGKIYQALVEKLPILQTDPVPVS